VVAHILFGEVQRPRQVVVDAAGLHGSAPSVFFVVRDAFVQEPAVARFLYIRAHGEHYP